MSEVQRQALSAMAARNLGALLVGGQWVWMQDVRESEDAAARVLRRLGGS